MSAMKELRSLASREGRTYVREIFRELRFDRQLSAFSTLSSMWRICTSERELYRYSQHEVSVLHPLGFWSGTSLWMQEIVNRFFYSTINSFVYFGASILLVVIGVRRFSENVSDSAVFASIILEAMLLVLMFVVMFFSPPDDIENGNTTTNEPQEDVLREIGEISRDYAEVALSLEQTVSTLKSMVHEQAEMVDAVKLATDAASHAVSPNPQLVETMKRTNEVLNEFKSVVESFVKAAEQLRRNEIDASVRREVERLLGAKVHSPS